MHLSAVLDPESDKKLCLTGQNGVDPHLLSCSSPNTSLPAPKGSNSPQLVQQSLQSGQIPGQSRKDLKQLPPRTQSARSGGGPVECC